MNSNIQILEYKDIGCTFSNEQIHDFINISMNKSLGRPLKLREDCYHIEDTYLKNSGNFWVAIDGEKIIGTIGLEDIGNRGILRRFYIAEEYQRIGIGSKMYFTLENYAIRKTNIKVLYLACGKILQNAHKFYIKHGFNQIEINDLDIKMHIGENDDIFKKNIKS